MTDKKVLMVRSDEWLNGDQVEAIREYYQSIFPQYKVAVMNKGLTLDFVWEQSACGN